MSSPSSSPGPQSGSPTRISTDTAIGVAVCSLLFIFIVAAFCAVSRKRQLWCFRRADLEAQRQRAGVDPFMLSLGSMPKVENKKKKKSPTYEPGRPWVENLGGTRASFDSDAPTMLDRSRTASTITLPSLVYDPTPRATLERHSGPGDIVADACLQHAA